MTVGIIIYTFNDYGAIIDDDHESPIFVLFAFQIQDPAGDEFPDVTLAENIISDIKALDGGELQGIS